MDKLHLEDMERLFMDEPWSNSACIGYAIIACERLNVDKSDIIQIIEQLNSIFDSVSLEKAKKKYSDY